MIRFSLTKLKFFAIQFPQMKINKQLREYFQTKPKNLDGNQNLRKESGWTAVIVPDPLQLVMKPMFKKIYNTKPEIGIFIIIIIFYYIV